MQHIAKILLIEDEDYIKDVYKDMLDSSGLKTDAFATGEAGLKAFHENSYDLVVLDIVLSDINGLHVLKEIKQDKIKKNIPVLLLTNLDQDIIVRQGLELGATAYLQKVSNTPDKIVDKIKNILELPPKG